MDKDYEKSHYKKEIYMRVMPPIFYDWRYANLSKYHFLIGKLLNFVIFLVGEGLGNLHSNITFWRV